MYSKRIFFIFSLLAFVFMSFATSIQAQEGVEAKFQEHSKKILDTLRSKNIKSTGVLKFSVRIGEGDFPPSLGAINMRLAEKLEVALALANPAAPRDKDKLVGICRSASDVANSIEDANHLTEDGRKSLFGKEYPLAFKLNDRESIVPDSLIAGVAQISSDLDKMDIELALILPDGGMEALDSFSVPTDLEDLMDAGESFSTRGIFFSGSSIEQGRKDEKKAVSKVIANAKSVRESNIQNGTNNISLHPLEATNDSPVKLEIRYDNVVQNLEFRDGAAFVKEPREGQKVIFVVRRNGADKTRYGILLKVNGENTLYRERKPDAKSSVWIMKPEMPAFSVPGFQIDKATRQEFKVLSDKESKSRAVNYGRDVGMINFVVYREREVEDLILDEDQELLDLQSQVALPKKTAESRGQLASSLFAQLSSQNNTRGLIVEGKETAAKVKTVTFDRDLTPVIVASIRYYNGK